MDIYAVIKKDTQEVVYIGQTKHTANFRWIRHITLANSGKGSILHKSIRCYGKEAFALKVLATVNSKLELDVLEQHYIAKYSPRYNLTSGGEHWRQVDVNSESEQQRRQKLKIAHNSPELLEKHRQHMIEQNNDPEFRKASSVRAKNMWSDDKFKQNMQEYWSETKQERSKFYSEKYATQEYKDKFSTINSEIMSRPEVKQKIKEKFYAAIERDTSILDKMRNGRPKRPIIGTNIASKEIREFAGIRIASRELGITASGIQKVLHKQILTTHGWYFEYTPEVVAAVNP